MFALDSAIEDPHLSPGTHDVLLTKSIGGSTLLLLHNDGVLECMFLHCFSLATALHRTGALLLATSEQPVYLY